MRRFAPVFWEVERRQRGLAGEAGNVVEIPARAEGPAFAPKDSHTCRRVGVEALKGRNKRVGAVRVHGVARFRAAVDDSPDRLGFLDTNAHRRLLQGNNTTAQLCWTDAPKKLPHLNTETERLATRCHPHGVISTVVRPGRRISGSFCYTRTVARSATLPLLWGENEDR